MNSFNEFGLAEPILRALTQEGYATPTPIQAQAIPVVVNGRDLIGIAQTGTGKTAAFALPILNRLAATPRRPEPKTCRVLILSPTRELSAQILDSFRTYGRHLRVSATLAIGGVKMGGQIKALARGVDILVATPGRLIDLMRSRAVRLDDVEAFVLDEADRMLDMGFIHDIRNIVTKIPAQRQTLLFSATMPPPIAELASAMLRDPVTVAVTPVATTAERIDQRVIHVERAAKSSLLAQLLREEPVERAIVFARTKHGADRIARGLVQSGIPAEAIHGNKSQGQRTRALADFKTGRVRTLIATDIAARGIDIDGISHVINFDLPHVAESYVHRIGRTARAGAEGIAISFCSGEERPLLRAIEKTIGQSIKATGEPGKLPSKARNNNGHRARGGAGHHGERKGRDDQQRRERRHSDGTDRRRDGKAHGRPKEPSERSRHGNGGNFMRELNSPSSGAKDRAKPVRFGARDAERATASDH